MAAHRHSRRCFGCSETTDRSLGIVLSWFPDGTEGRARFGPEHTGPPGLVHGGLLATFADEVMGSVEHGGTGLRLTSDMTLRYRQPVPLDTDLVCRAHVDDVSGRRFTVVAEITTADAPNAVLTEATATYVLMDNDEDGRG